MLRNTLPLPPFLCHPRQKPAPQSCGVSLIPLMLLGSLSASDRMHTEIFCLVTGGALTTLSNSLWVFSAFCAWRDQKYVWETIWILALTPLACMTLDISASYLRVVCRWPWKIIMHHPKSPRDWFIHPKPNCLREKT